MKKKILFITREFTPITNASISCLENFLPYLGQQHEIILYTPKYSFESKKYERLFNINIYRVISFYDYPILFKKHLMKSIDRFNLAIKYKHILKVLTKGVFHPLIIIAKKKGILSGKFWEDNFYQVIETKENIESFDAILTVGAPFQNFEIAYRIKKMHPHLQMILIAFDLFTDNPVLLVKDKKYSVNRDIRLSKDNEWFKYADCIFATREMKNQIMKSELNIWDKKIHCIGTPNLINILDFNPTDIFETFDKDFIHVVFTGVFYPEIRNPYFMLILFEKICIQNPNIYLHLFSTGCDDIIYDFKKRIGNHLMLHGFTSRTMAINALYSANILINISNNSSNQSPSKIIEYIGSGKPIINLFSIDNDLSKALLKEYPLCLSIKEESNNIVSYSKCITDFIAANKNSMCSFSLVKDLFKDYLPEVFSNRISESLDYNNYFLNNSVT